MTFLQELLAKPETFQWFDRISLQFLSRFLVDVLATFVLVRFIYFRHYRRTDLFLTFFGFNIIIFMITYLLNKVEMSMGAAFGLFAVFSMLRYRTENISAKDMTYLFIVIALGLITAISQGSWDELAIMCLILLAFTGLLEGSWLIKKEATKTVIYDKIDLVTPDRREELIQDLKQRTGLDIHRVDVRDIDFLKDATQITLYYYEK